MPLFIYLVSDIVKVAVGIAVILYVLVLILSFFDTNIPIGWEPTRMFVEKNWSGLSAAVHQSGEDLYEGKREEEVKFAGVTVFSYKALPATLRHAGSATALDVPANEDPANLSCVLYFGESGGAS